MNVLGRHVGRSSLLACAAVVLAAAVLAGLLGLTVVWIVAAAAFCLAMMLAMVWMMVGMGRGAMHRH